MVQPMREGTCHAGICTCTVCTFLRLAAAQLLAVINWEKPRMSTTLSIEAGETITASDLRPRMSTPEGSGHDDRS
jgi:hypothetical protein